MKCFVCLSYCLYSVHCIFVCPSNSNKLLENMKIDFDLMLTQFVQRNLNNKI